MSELNWSESEVLSELLEYRVNCEMMLLEMKRLHPDVCCLDILRNDDDWQFASLMMKHAECIVRLALSFFKNAHRSREQGAGQRDPLNAFDGIF